MAFEIEKHEGLLIYQIQPVSVNMFVGHLYFLFYNFVYQQNKHKFERFWLVDYFCNFRDQILSCPIPPPFFDSLLISNNVFRRISDSSRVCKTKIWKHKSNVFFLNYSQIKIKITHRKEKTKYTRKRFSYILDITINLEYLERVSVNAWRSTTKKLHRRWQNE